MFQINDSNVYKISRPFVTNPKGKALNHVNGCLTLSGFVGVPLQEVLITFKRAKLSWRSCRHFSLWYFLLSHNY